MVLCCFVLLVSGFKSKSNSKRKKERKKGKVLVWVDPRASKRDGREEGEGFTEKVERGTGNRRNRKEDETTIESESRSVQRQ